MVILTSDRFQSSVHYVQKLNFCGNGICGRCKLQISLAITGYVHLINKSRLVCNFDERLLKNIASKIVSITKLCKKQIDNMKKAFKENNFKDATTGDITT